MTSWGVSKLVDYEMTFYPHGRPAAHFSGKGREKLERCYMEAFEGIDDEVVHKAYLRLVRGKAPMPTVPVLIEAAGWADKVDAEHMKTISGSDIRRIPQWEIMKKLDEQDGRKVEPDEWYQKKYGY